MLPEIKSLCILRIDKPGFICYNVDTEREIKQKKIEKIKKGLDKKEKVC